MRLYQAFNGYWIVIGEDARPTWSETVECRFIEHVSPTPTADSSHSATTYRTASRSEISGRLKCKFMHHRQIISITPL